MAKNTEGRDKPKKRIDDFLDKTKSESEKNENTQEPGTQKPVQNKEPETQKPVQNQAPKTQAPIEALKNVLDKAKFIIDQSKTVSSDLSQTAKVPDQNIQTPDNSDQGVAKNAQAEGKPEPQATPAQTTSSQPQGQTQQPDQSAAQQPQVTNVDSSIPAPATTLTAEELKKQEMEQLVAGFIKNPTNLKSQATRVPPVPPINNDSKNESEEPQVTNVDSSIPGAPNATESKLTDEEIEKLYNELLKRKHDEKQATIQNAFTEIEQIDKDKEALEEKRAKAEEFLNSRGIIIPRPKEETKKKTKRSKSKILTIALSAVLGLTTLGGSIWGLVDHFVTSKNKIGDLQGRIEQTVDSLKSTNETFVQKLKDVSNKVYLPNTLDIQGYEIIRDENNKITGITLTASAQLDRAKQEDANRNLIILKLSPSDALNQEEFAKYAEALEVQTYNIKEERPLEEDVVEQNKENAKRALKELTLKAEFSDVSTLSMVCSQEDYLKYDNLSFNIVNTENYYEKDDKGRYNQKNISKLYTDKEKFNILTDETKGGTEVSNFNKKTNIYYGNFEPVQDDANSPIKNSLDVYFEVAPLGIIKQVTLTAETDRRITPKQLLDAYNLYNAPNADTKTGEISITDEDTKTTTKFSKLISPDTLPKQATLLTGKVISEQEQTKSKDELVDILTKTYDEMKAEEAKKEESEAKASTAKRLAGLKQMEIENKAVLEKE